MKLVIRYAEETPVIACNNYRYDSLGAGRGWVSQGDAQRMCAGDPVRLHGENDARPLISIDRKEDHAVLELG